MFLIRLSLCLLSLIAGYWLTECFLIRVLSIRDYHWQHNVPRMATNQWFIFYLLLLLMFELGCVIKTTTLNQTFLCIGIIFTCETKINGADVFRRVEIKMTQLWFFFCYIAGIRGMRVCLNCSIWMFSSYLMILQLPLFFSKNVKQTDFWCSVYMSVFITINLFGHALLYREIPS